MCFFKKRKPKEVFTSKYHIGSEVSFKHRDNNVPGVVVDVRKENDVILYDIQVGGECPYVRENIPEKDIIPGVR